MHQKRSIIAVLIGLFLFTGCARLYKLPRSEEIKKSNWAFSRNNIAANAAIESDFEGKLNIKWKSKLYNLASGPLTFGGNSIINSGENGRLGFYAPSSGHYKGQIRARTSVQTGLTVVDSFVYYAEVHDRNRLICRNLHNRRKVWSLAVKDVTGAPIIIDKHIFIASADGDLMSLDRMTGDIIWRDTASSRCLPGPSGKNDIIYFPLADGEVRGYEMNEGKQVFRIQLNEPVVSKAVIDDKIYISGSQGSLYALDKLTGKVIWQKNYGSAIWTTPVVDGKRLYYGDNGGNLVALDKDSGEKVWSFDCGGVIAASPIIVGDFIIAASLDRHLYCVERKEGLLNSKLELDREIDTAPISDGQNIYVSCRDKFLYCIGD
jgi:outer membrane protein assembly factor BamB